MKILVVGDRIFDHYKYCKATRLCPEGPAPVLIVQKEITSEGGASLVAENLKSLFGKENILTEFGSVSNKTRIFADRTLVCRLDQDQYSIADKKGFWNQCLAKLAQAEVVVVGDYGKGAMNAEIASGINSYCLQNDKKLFVDCKVASHLNAYYGCFALFPNEDEHNGLDPESWQHIIRKLGPRGCSVDNVLVPTEEQQVYDVTGAGDVFLAAFVVRYVTHKNIFEGQELLKECARWANKAAGVSVRHLGTYVVQSQEVGV